MLAPKKMTSVVRSFLLLIWVICLGALVAAPATAHAATSQIRITEIMYDPSGNGDREFVELYNGYDTTANLGGFEMFGVA